MKLPKKTLQIVSIIIMILIISIPFSLAEQLSVFNEKSLENVEGETLSRNIAEENILVYSNNPFGEVTGDVIEGFESSAGSSGIASEENKITGNVAVMTTPSDYKQKCIDRSEQTSALVDLMDSGIIEVLEKVFATMYLICTIYSALDSVWSTFKLIFGTPCFSWVDCPEVAATEVPYQGFMTTLLEVFQPICCLITCGWCTGDGCGGILDALDFDLYEGATESVMKGAALGPYDNIYTSIACLCPGAILFNMRKLKKIYQVYDCCIDQACGNGLSTETCEKQFSYASCMYWEGSIMMTVANAISTFIAGAVANFITGLLTEHLTKIWSSRLTGMLQLIMLPGLYQGLSDAMDWFDESFDDPTCEDLGFKELKAAEVKAKKGTVTCSDDDDDSTCKYNRPSGSLTVSEDGTEFINQGFKHTKAKGYEGKETLAKEKADRADIYFLSQLKNDKIERDIDPDTKKVTYYKLDEEGERTKDTVEPKDFTGATASTYQTNLAAQTSQLGQELIKANKDLASAKEKGILGGEPKQEDIAAKEKAQKKAQGDYDNSKAAQEKISSDTQSENKLYKDNYKSLADAESDLTKSQSGLSKLDQEILDAEIAQSEVKGTAEEDAADKKLEDLEENRKKKLDDVSKDQDALTKAQTDTFKGSKAAASLASATKSGAVTDMQYTDLKTEIDKNQGIIDSSKEDGSGISPEKLSEAKANQDSIASQLDSQKKVADTAASANPETIAYANLQDKRNNNDLGTPAGEALERQLSSEAEALKDKGNVDIVLADRINNNGKVADLEGDLRAAKADPSSTAKDIAKIEGDLDTAKDAAEESNGETSNSAEDQAAAEALEKQMGAAVSALLSKLLNEYAYEEISEYCEDQWNSSDTE